MNELDSKFAIPIFKQIVKSVCKEYDIKEEVTQEYLNVAERFVEFYTDFLNQNDADHLGDLLEHSSQQGALKDALNFTRLALSSSNTRLFLSPLLGGNYTIWSRDLAIGMLFVFYYIGYRDGLTVETPEAFDDFISSLNLNDD